MHFGLTEEQEMIVSTVRSFVENEIYPHEAEVERTGTVPPELGQAIKQKVIDLGLYACNFPEEVGGAGLSPASGCGGPGNIGRGAHGARRLAQGVDRGSSHPARGRRPWPPPGS